MSRSFLAFVALVGCADARQPVDAAPSVDPADPADPPVLDPPDVPVALPDPPAADTAAPCAPPAAPLLSHLAYDDALTFADDVETALGDADFAAQPTVDLSAHRGPVRVRARAPGCDAELDHTYVVVDAFPTDDAVAADAPVAWATGWVEVVYGAEVDPAWQTPGKALGPATGASGDICALGDGGRLTLAFDRPAVDGPGPDLAVFENAFSDTFLELARVEVSSDGYTFAAFDAVSRGQEPVDAFGAVHAAGVWGLAGRYRGGLGTPFDLAVLRAHPDVHAGAVDLDAIRYVRLTDVIGDGHARDAFGRPIWDPHPTVASAGFDVEAVGVLNVAP